MAEQKRDYYEVLGVDKNADEAATAAIAAHPPRAARYEGLSA